MSLPQPARKPADAERQVEREGRIACNDLALARRARFHIALGEFAERTRRVRSGAALAAALTDRLVRYPVLVGGASTTGEWRWTRGGKPSSVRNAIRCLGRRSRTSTGITSVQAIAPHCTRAWVAPSQPCRRLLGIAASPRTRAGVGAATTHAHRLRRSRDAVAHRAHATTSRSSSATCARKSSSPTSAIR